MSDTLNQRPQSPVLNKKSLLDDGFSLQLTVPPDLIYFDGHFTDVPVVPGVCQVKWVVDALQEHTGAPLKIESMEAVKFFNLLFPGQAFIMNVRRKGEKWHYHLTSNGKNIARGRIVTPSLRGQTTP